MYADFVELPPNDIELLLNSYDVLGIIHSAIEYSRPEDIISDEYWKTVRYHITRQLAQWGFTVENGYAVSFIDVYELVYHTAIRVLNWNVVLMQTYKQLVTV